MKKIKEMIYCKDKLMPSKVLAKDNYNGYEFAVVSYSCYPCAYVCIPEDHPFYGKICEDGFYCNLIKCHSSITYANFKKTRFNPDQKFWIGWNYATAFDYIGYYNNLRNTGDNYKKWTTEEIIEEIKDVIVLKSNKLYK